jgi:integrase
MPDYRLKSFRGYWHAVWSENGGTKRVSLRTKDRAEAERSLADLRKNTNLKDPTVGDIVEAYLEDKKDTARSHGRMEFAWQAARGTFANLRPDQITRDVCRRYTKRRRAEGVGDATILKEINTVRQAMNWAKEGRPTFEAPSAPAPRDRHLTRAEYERLLAACRQPHVRLFVILALSTAGRKEAVLDLTWSRVDFERNQVRLEVPGEKNRKGRATVTMTDRLRRELLTAKDAAVTPYVIEYGGEKVGNIKKGFAAAVERAGLKDVTPHDLRHTAAVWMAEAGTPIAEIAQVLGHSDMRTTFRVYARFSPEHLAGAISALEF